LAIFFASSSVNAASDLEAPAIEITGTQINAARTVINTLFFSYFIVLFLIVWQKMGPPEDRIQEELFLRVSPANFCPPIVPYSARKRLTCSSVP